MLAKSLFRDNFKRGDIKSNKLPLKWKTLESRAGLMLGMLIYG